jgi:hypothetical protein
MAISTVRVQINGTWTNLTYNSSTGAYEATITAPSVTSHNRTGGYYPVTVEAKNTVGTVTTVTDSHSTLGASCKLVVQEKVAPVITIVSPTSGARVTSNKQPVVFNVVDESNGSGIDIQSLVVQLDDREQNELTLERTTITNGYRYTFIPGTALADGEHRFSARVSDNDGNLSNLVDIVFTIDTVAPTLNITSPAEGMATASTSVTVAGTTNDATSSPVTLTMTLDSGAAQAVTVATNGSFTKTFTGLSHGGHKVVIVAKDAAGKTTSITRNFTVDTSAPVISKITISPNPVDAGNTMKISVVVSG